MGDRGSERVEEIVSGLGLLRNCILCFISLSSGSRHCLLLYGRVRKEQGNRRSGRRRGRGETTVRVMRCWRSVLTRRSLRHFIKGGHGAVQLGTHFLCTARRATSFLSALVLSLIFSTSSAASSHFLRCSSQLSCACRNDIHSWPKSFHLALTTFGIFELTSRVETEGRYRSEGGGGSCNTLSKMTTKCSDRRMQNFSVPVQLVPQFPQLAGEYSTASEELGKLRLICP